MVIHRIEIYIDQVIRHSRRHGATADELRAELRDHLMAAVEHWMSDGATQDDAALRAVYDHGDAQRVGSRLRERTRFVDVAFTGTARGVIAIGPRAIGVVAVGWVAIGIFAVGPVAIGAVSVGVFSLAAMLGWGMVSVSSVAVGFATVGLISQGHFAVGLASCGTWAVGLWVPIEEGVRQRISFYSTEAVAPSMLTNCAVSLTLRDLALILLPLFVSAIAICAFAFKHVWAESRKFWRTKNLRCE